MSFYPGEQVRLRQVFTVVSNENGRVKVEAGGYYETYFAQQLVSARDALISGDLVWRGGVLSRIVTKGERIDSFATESERKEFFEKEKQALTENYNAAVASIENSITEFQQMRKELEEKFFLDCAKMEQNRFASNFPALPQLEK